MFKRKYFQLLFPCGLISSSGHSGWSEVPSNRTLLPTRLEARGGQRSLCVRGSLSVLCGFCMVGGGGGEQVNFCGKYIHVNAFDKVMSKKSK